MTIHVAHGYLGKDRAMNQQALPPPNVLACTHTFDREETAQFALEVAQQLFVIADELRKTELPHTGKDIGHLGSAVLNLRAFLTADHCLACGGSGIDHEAEFDRPCLICGGTGERQ